MKVSSFKLGVGNPPTMIHHIIEGHIYRLRGEFAEAAIAYQAAATVRPNEGGPHYFLGEVYQALGKFEPAEAEYRQAAKLDPLESQHWLALGRMQWNRNNRVAAISSFRTAVLTTPGWGQAHAALANALLAEGDPDEASEQYQLAQIADGDIHEGVVYDFTAHLAEAKFHTPNTDYIRADYFNIGNKQERVLFMHPDSRAEFVIDLAEYKEPFGLKFVFDIATSPESWKEEGDGVTFTVQVVENQEPSQVFTTYIDPKNDPNDQRWIPCTVDLSAFAGQTVRIILETSPGPAGDDRFDWAGWGEPRLEAYPLDGD